MSALTYRERPAAGDPAGLLVLHHGRGADEHDLLGLADVARPAAPAARRHAARAADAPRLARQPLVRRAARRLPRPATRSTPPTPSSPRSTTSCGSAPASRPRDTVFGGFSMGSVMSYALGLGGDRPAPAGILAFSGFVPTVEGWQPDLAVAPGPARVHRPRPPRPDHGGRLRPPRPRAAGGRRAAPSTTTSPTPAHHIDPAHVPPRSPGSTARSRRRPAGDGA